LNETIARDANKEDGCPGRFWEGRFKSQALVDQGALLACMAYVDLNPIRAGQAETPEESLFTSIHERIQAYLRETADSGETVSATLPDDETGEAAPTTMTLMPLRGEREGSFSKEEPVLPMSFEEYLGLLDWSGRAIVEGKSGHIPESLDHILRRINLSTEGWLPTIQRFQRDFGRAAGNLKGLQQIEQVWGAKGLKGKHKAKELYQHAA
ncbi:transposase, partial [Deltaproteobacteria bacterium TL4]